MQVTINNYLIRQTGVKPSISLAGGIGNVRVTNDRKLIITIHDKSSVTTAQVVINQNELDTIINSVQDQLRKLLDTWGKTCA